MRTLSPRKKVQRPAYSEHHTSRTESSVASAGIITRHRQPLHACSANANRARRLMSVLRLAD
jgi:hypothetical protein